MCLWEQFIYFWSSIYCFYYAVFFTFFTRSFRTFTSTRCIACRVSAWIYCLKWLLLFNIIISNRLFSQKGIQPVDMRCRQSGAPTTTFRLNHFFNQICFGSMFTTNSIYIDMLAQIPLVNIQVWYVFFIVRPIPHHLNRWYSRSDSYSSIMRCYCILRCLLLCFFIRLPELIFMCRGDSEKRDGIHTQRKEMCISHSFALIVCVCVCEVLLVKISQIPMNPTTKIHRLDAPIVELIFPEIKRYDFGFNITINSLSRCSIHCVFDANGVN